MVKWKKRIINNKETIMRLWENFKAWRRGEKRVKGATRGRMYRRPEDTEPSASTKMKSKATLKVSKITVIRADGSTEEIL